MLENKKKPNIFDSQNMFISAGSGEASPDKSTNPIEQTKFINDFDSSLILSNIDKTTKNKAVRLNLKINTLEKNLAQIDEQLELLQLLNLEKDASKKEQLLKFKSYLELQINRLKAEKKKFGIIYSISGFFAEKIDFQAFRLKFEILQNLIKTKLPRRTSNLKTSPFARSDFKW